MRLKALFLTLAAGCALIASVPSPLAAQDAAPVLRADARAYLDRMAASPRPALNEQTVAMMRKIPPEVIARMMAANEAPIGALAVDRKLTMPNPGAGPGATMDLRVFDTRAERGAGPVVVFYHGGGFVVGSIGTHAALAAEMSRQLDLPVVSVEYRLAPEAKWPAAPDDAEAAARWVAANGAALGRVADSLVLTGDSAGGTLTLVTALALRDKPAAVPVKLMIPLYPMPQTSSARAIPRCWATSRACRPRCWPQPGLISYAMVAAPLPQSWPPAVYPSAIMKRRATSTASRHSAKASLRRRVILTGSWPCPAPCSVDEI